METNKINVMGKEMQIPEGMTFGELAKEFQGDFPSAILLAKQGNVLKELDMRSQMRTISLFLTCGMKKACACITVGSPSCW